MPTKIGQISEMELKQVPLPTGFSKQYVTVSHGYIIDTVKNLLDQNNYEVNETIYRCTNGGEVVQAVYHINHGDDPELGLMFAWSNSYDRSQRFKCAVGAHVFICGNGMLIGDMANYGKVHKGDKKQVLQNVTDHIEIQLKSASNFYDMIKKDKEAMKNICLTEKEMAELMGVLYFQEDLLTSGQLIVTKQQYEKPSFDYNAPLNSLWSLYNHVTYSFKASHPKKWMDTQANFHEFIAKTYIPKPVIDPNQMNITDVIEVPDDQLITSEITPSPLECSKPEDTEFDTPYDLPLGEDDMNSCSEATEEETNELLHGVDNTGGLDHKDEFPEHDPVSLRVRDGEIEQFDDETGEVVKNEALDNAANEEVDHGHNFSQNMVETVAEALDETPDQVNNAFAGIKNQMDEAAAEIKADEESDMIEKEEIIEEREAEDVLDETEVIEESKEELSFDNYFGEEPIDDDINLSDVNDMETELKNGSQEDLDEKVEEKTSEEVSEEVVEESNEGKLELPDFEF